MWPFRTKVNPVNKTIVALYGGSSVVWTPKDYRSLAIAGYQNCSTAFACVKLIAQTASRINWTLGRYDANGDIAEFDRHPLLDLLNRPNEDEGGSRFGEKSISYLLLAGNSYELAVRGRPSAAPSFLYCLRPDRMTINPDKTGATLVSSYTYSMGASRQDFQAQDVLHLMEFHPTDDLYGLSRIEVAAQQIDQMNLSAEWNASNLKNGMQSPGVVTSKSTFDLETVKKLWRENYQGADKAGTPIVLEGEDVKWQPLSMTPKDADWLQGQKLTMRQICSIFGIASELLGDSENKTYSNIQEARKALYQEVVLPIMDLRRDEYQRWLVPYYGQGLVLDYDRDAIEELQEDRGKKYEYLAKARWLTVNEKREACGYDAIPEGDVLDVPAVPDFGMTDEEEEPELAPAPTKSVGRMTKSKWREPDNAKALWDAFDTRARKRGATFLELAYAYLKMQAERVADKMGAYSSLGSVRMEQVFNIHDEAQLYVKQFWAWYANHYGRAVQAGLRASKGEIFDDAETKASWTISLTPEQEERLRRMVFNSGTKVNETTIGVIYEQLKKAQEANSTVAEFTAAIRENVDEFSRSRAELWAATESVKVDSCGQLDGFKETEFVTGKGWLSAFLPTSREEHEQASGTEIGLDDKWKVGDSMLAYPGDPDGKPGDICNCRCSIYPVVGD